MTFLEVAVSAPLEHTLTYSVSEQHEFVETGHLVGSRVLVSLGNRKVTGYVVGLQPTPLETAYKIKEILKFLGDAPIFHENLVPFFRWVANYYHYPLGLVMKTALPGGLTQKSQKKLVLKTDSASLTTLFTDKIPEWITQIAAQGWLGPRDTARILADKSSKKLAGRLLKTQMLSLEVLLSQDTVGEKRETCYAFAHDHLAPPMDIDASPEKIKKYRQNISTENRVELSISEARALYSLHRLTQKYHGKSVALRDLRSCYTGASKASSNSAGKRTCCGHGGTGFS